MDYWAFVNRYKIHIADRLDSDDLRLTYLLQHCTQKVNDKMKHHTSSSNPKESYELAWKELYDRYGQPHIIARCCEKRLLETPKISKNDPDSLEKLAVLLKRCCVSLEGITELSTADSVGFIVSIATKLPSEMQSKWVSASVSLEEKTGRVVTRPQSPNSSAEYPAIRSSGPIPQEQATLKWRLERFLDVKNKR